MKEYKRFLYTSERMHRSTAYRRRKAERLRAAQMEILNLKRQAASHREELSKLRPQTPLNQTENVPQHSTGGLATNQANESNESANLNLGHGMLIDVVEYPLAPEDDMNLSQGTQPVSAALTSSPSHSSDTRFEEDKGDHGASSFSTSTPPAPNIHPTTHYGNPCFKEKLGPCTPISSYDVSVMVVALALRHKLTWAAQEDVLKIIRTIFPKSHIPTTKYKLSNRVGSKPDIIFHVFCHKCQKYLTPKNEMNDTEVCDNCKSTVLASKAANYFISLSMRKQLQQLLEGPDDIGDIVMSYRFNRNKKNVNNFEDIYDGSEYRRHTAKGEILSLPQNFSYNFFTDGVAMGNSGKSIWPIHISINELPHKLRAKYMLPAGLYVGPSDPNLTMFLRPFVEEANSLSTVGFAWKLRGKEIKSRVIPMCAVVDSVARFKLMNMQSFHAHRGCTYCSQVQERGSKRLKWTVQSEREVVNRTRETFKCDLDQLHEEIRSNKNKKLQEDELNFRGVKGPSCLWYLKNFDLSKGVVVDYMHCILQGVIKSHTELIFDASFKKKCWFSSDEVMSMEDIVGAVDEKLLLIKPPKSITRIPQPLAKRAYWKASEWRSWLIFYCIVCLKDLLREDHLVLLAMLSKAAFILLQDSISNDDVHEAHNLLLKYQYQFQNLFGVDSMLYNIHLLRHICSGVLRYGPVWTHNTFPYEGYNRYLLQLCKSPFNVSLQICNKYTLFQRFPELCADPTLADETLDYCEEILDSRLKKFVNASGVLLLGKGAVKCTLNEGEYEVLNIAIGSSDIRCSLAYTKMLLNGYRLCTNTSGNNTDCYVYSTCNNLVRIRHILHMTDKQVFIIAQKVEIEPEPLVLHPHVTLSHVKRIENEYSDYVCLSPGQISRQCIFMDLGSEKFVCPFPFGCYGD